jgi:hypothetical protein
MRLNPTATFDCLFLVHRLQCRLASIAVPEIHLFAYLACLLWMFRQRPVSDWEYSFVGTELGAPFSRDIDEALKELLDRGYLRREPGYGVRWTRHVKDTLRELLALSLYQDRRECLEAACSSIAAFSVGMVNAALANEPDLSRSKALPSTRQLLEESATSQLYIQFEALRIALSGRTADLRLPAVVWLSALYRSQDVTIPRAND